MHTVASLVRWSETENCTLCAAAAPGNAGPDAPTFAVLTMPNATQQRALERIQQIRL
jgi:hypothetical protein